MLTPQQIIALNQATGGNVNPSAPAPTPQQQQATQATNSRVNELKQIAQRGNVQPAQDNGTAGGFVTNVNNDLSSAGNDFAHSIIDAPQRVQEITKATGSSGLGLAGGIGETGLRAAGAAGGGLMSFAGDVAKTIPGVSQLLDHVTKNLSDQQAAADPNSPGQKIVSFISQLIQDHPEIAKDLGAGANIAAAEGGFESLTKAGEKLPGTVNSIKNAGSNIVDAASTAKNSINESLQSKFTNDAIDEWKKPSTIAKPSYGKAADIVENAAKNGHDIPKTLVNNGIKLSDNVEGGNYATSDTAEKIRTDAGKTSRELLRPSLQMADYTTPKTSVDDILKKTISDIKGSKGITPGDIEAQIQKATTEADALKRKFPDGMSLTDMHDNKINYASNGKYSPIGDINANNTAAVNRSFGRTLGGLVESNAPEGIPVKEFNAELQKQYQAADYLDALNGKKVPVSLGSKIANSAGKIAGAAVGSSVGGGVLGGVGGYHIGGMVENLLESMPNPIKGHFLDNLERTNPEAFTAVKNFIGDEKVAQLQRRMLPAPRFIPASEYKGGESGVDSYKSQQFSNERNQVIKTNNEDVSSFRSQKERDAYVASQGKEANAVNELRDSLIKSGKRSDFEKLSNRFKSKESWLNFTKNNPALTSKIKSTGATPDSIWEIMNKAI